jgi:hypothetical protein
MYYSRTYLYYTSIILLVYSFSYYYYLFENDVLFEN